VTEPLENIRTIAGRVAGSYGLEVVDVELRGAGKSRMLRIYIDRPGGVTHGDCEAVSREVGAILDVEDAVPGSQYVLEVSSPGLDRRLLKPADYERFAGRRIRLHTREAVDGQRKFEGRLLGLREGRVALALQPPDAAGRDHSPARRRPAAAGGKSASQAQASPVAEREFDLAEVERANLVPEF
jgi:ribosome maturation factor RimP